MKFENYKSLTEDEKIKYLCQTGGDSELFRSIREVFLREFSCDKVIEVIVDRYGIGEVPAVVVSLKKGQKKFILPKSFMGLPVIRRYK